MNTLYYYIPTGTAIHTNKGTATATDSAREHRHSLMSRRDIYRMFKNPLDRSAVVSYEKPCR